MYMLRAMALAGLGLVSLLAQADPAEKQIRQALKTLDSEIAIQSISSTPAPGVYQVELEWNQGKQFLYVMENGKYLLQGYLYKVDGGEAENLTEKALNTSVRKEMAKVPVGETVLFSPAAPKATITVFTDTDCPYCQHLHKEVPELNRQGVAVRYLAYPRAGINSETAKTLESIWCANDRPTALTRAKAGETIAKKSCASPVAKQYELGMRIGIRGTPAIVLEDGQIIPGYRPAAILSKLALEAAASTRID